MNVYLELVLISLGLVLFVCDLIKEIKRKKQEKNRSQNERLICGAIGTLSSLVLLICMIIDLIK